jgi:hypothetical protein
LILWSEEAGSLKMNTALEYSTRVVQEGGRRCKKSTLNDLEHLTPLRIPLMNPPKFVIPVVRVYRTQMIKAKSALFGIFPSLAGEEGGKGITFF